MSYRIRKFSLVIIVLMIITSGCFPSNLPDVVQLAPEIIVITVEVPVVQTPVQEQAEPPTPIPPPPIPPTLEPPTLISGQLLSCLSGPHWILFKWLGRVETGEKVTLLAKSISDWGEYYFVEKENGSTCWIYGGTSEKRGDYKSIPVKEAPPLPETTYKIKNRSLLAVCNVYIRPQDNTTWGADWLGADVILPEEDYAFNLISGYYDIRILDCFNDVMYEEHDRAIGMDGAYRETKITD